MNIINTRVPYQEYANAYLPTKESAKKYAYNIAKLSFYNSIACYGFLGFAHSRPIGIFIQVLSSKALFDFAQSIEMEVSPKVIDLIPAAIYDSRSAKAACQIARVSTVLFALLAGQKVAQQFGYNVPYYLLPRTIVILNIQTIAKATPGAIRYCILKAYECLKNL